MPGNISQNKCRLRCALINEGIARLKLADMGIDSKENLENAVSLCGDARKFFPKQVQIMLVHW